MTLPSSGKITFDDIKTEYSGSNDFRAYLRGGSFVPNTTPNQNVATSGILTISSFYGANALIEILTLTGAQLSISGAVEYNPSRGIFGGTLSPSNTVTGVGFITQIIIGNGTDSNNMSITIQSNDPTIPPAQTSISLISNTEFNINFIVIDATYTPIDNSSQWDLELSDPSANTSNQNTITFSITV